MRRAAQRLRLSVLNSGDTLIEVLLAVTVVSAVLIGAFVVVQQSFKGIRTGQEQSEVAQVLQGQVELVRDMALGQSDSLTGVFSTLPKYFCIDTATGTRANFDPAYNLGTLAADDFSMYPAACRDIGGYYNVAVTYDSAASTFHFTSRWDRVGGSRNQSEVSYRVFPGSPLVTTADFCTVNTDIALVLDNSSSMGRTWQTTTRRAKLLEVTRRFIANSAFAPGQNHGSVIEFNTGARTLQTLTGDESLLTSSLSRMRSAVGTYYVAALNEADTRLSAADSRPAARKIIIFISDGEPSEPTATIYPLSTAMKAKGYAIYSIAVNTNLVAKDIMSRISGGPGGGYAPADSEADLDRVMDDLSNSLSCG